MLGLLVACLLLGRVVAHAYVAASAIATLVVLGLVWPTLAIRLVSAELICPVRRGRVGESVEATLRTRNRWITSITGFVLQLHRSLTVDSTLLSLPRGWSTTSIRVTPARRGSLDLQAAQLSTAEPFGLHRASRLIRTDASLIIHPAPLPCPIDLSISRNAILSTDLASSRIAEEGELVGVRNYRRGDSIRAVHWQQTARHDRLIVRERASSDRSECHLHVDLRAGSYDDDDTFERAISLAAGAVLAASELGLSLHLHLGKRELVITPRRGLDAAMDALALIERDAPGAAGINRVAGAGIYIGTARGHRSIGRNALRPIFAHDEVSR